ncbi:MAG: DNA-directed RNA polymerase subunit beta [Candidatus Eisenbacteria bacterium]|nr:DNA-directed RNA polymerase subunit beta [Candidatus Eisenbacteria bacterium]
MPNLLDAQLQSYNAFLQADVEPAQRKEQGLQLVFKEVFPITDARESIILDFVSYSIGRPKYTERECIERDLTFSVPLKAALRLMVNEDVEDQKRTREIIEQEVYLGELPLITEKGTFIINGAERVVVSQLHRSPGVFFDDEIHPNGKRLFSARVIPYRGPWVEFSLDIKDVMYVHSERKRKIPVTVLLRALGYQSDESIIKLFYKTGDADVDGPVGKASKLVGKTVAAPIPDPTATEGELLFKAGHELSEGDVDVLRAHNISSIEVVAPDRGDGAGVLLNSLRRDTTSSEKEALIKIYNLMRPGDPPNLETARNFLHRLFFSPKRYDLGRVGRYKLNQRLKLKTPMEERVLTVDDIVAIINALRELRNGKGIVDDIDHLGNRRARPVGELLANQLLMGLTRMARIVRERMSLLSTEEVKPNELVNSRTVSAVVNAFFGSSQLSQFMDQTNPLAEVTNKRRLSALGPGGLTRDRAGFEVRDVHHTHYGRLCPVETPEGPNIGLIASLATYARINDYGFLETPYRKVKDGRVTDSIEYLTADRESNKNIVQASEPVDAGGTLLTDVIMARRGGDFPLVRKDQIDYMDVAPMQMVSVAAALIPFLEHDDANRALMGSNMQRQAVPLLVTEPPLVGTGLEYRCAVDSAAVVVAKRDGIVERVTGDTVRIDFSQGRLHGDPSELLGLDAYRLTKFTRSNQDTCINQRPLVRKGDVVRKGQVIADGPATAGGELALGRNVLVAFMPWRGFNFEDAIVVGENLVKDDTFTSIHIEEFELQVRETKQGPEEITKELPNVGETAIRNLDEDGIIRVGAEVYHNDILVGKVTPKGETKLSPEERLLRAIFGEKARDVRDASLKAPPGMDGIVIEVKVFSRRDRNERVKADERRRIDKLTKDKDTAIRRIRDVMDRQIRETLAGQRAGLFLDDASGMPIFRKGELLSDSKLLTLDTARIRRSSKLVKDPGISEEVSRVLEAASEATDATNRNYDREVERITKGDELPAGVLKLVKVYVARKRKLSVGDKMAGRHGNKGVVSVLVPQEDMPFMPDGRPVEMVLNPLGVPSRMNVGQILETHLGWAAHELGERVASPVFTGATLQEVEDELQRAGLPTDGKTVLYDGRSGEPFHERITVGYLYMMKLSHLVDDKIHARSIGPYSLVTQQPLGGKAQFGGQRFGEMEVWALEAYGAAYTLQELLTVKSDDVVGRSRVYESIVKGENPAEPGIPESFNVLVKEMQSLCLDVELEEF